MNFSKTMQHFIKFGAIGVFTTLIGITAYYILLEKKGYPIFNVYVCVWIALVFISFLLNTLFNYKKTINLKDLMIYYYSYLIGFLVGFLIVYTLKYIELGLSDFHILLITILPRFVIVFTFIEKFAHKKFNTRY